MKYVYGKVAIMAVSRVSEGTHKSHGWQSP